MLRAFIGLGSNLANKSGDSRQILRDAVTALKAIAIGDVSVSSLYSSSPMGPQDQPDYINAVAMFYTHLQPHALLDQLQAIEQDAGRIRLRRWGERTLDLDILILNPLIQSDFDKNESNALQQQSSMLEIHDERLILPHIGILDRAFVVQPLLELDADLSINALRLAECAAASTKDGIYILEDSEWAS
ncbi:MAG: 2-amino-4-hydroxy-6-hydroxymethyldihydropteridine diphosphokinase [Candidatus Saccharibacteria bacterium]|nr:2-amino-4-hydroxy-6-hydroxymethyldihydropteridine diphosphokinase [Moraxellaceae bacterium]